MNIVGTLTLLVGVMATPFVSAQFEPAAEMAKFDVAIGNWICEGRVIPNPGSPPVQWSGVSTWSKVFGGHFVIEDMKLSGGGMPGVMLWRTIYRWDANNKTYSRVYFSNSGSIESGPVYWAGNKLINSITVASGDGTKSDHGSTTFTGDTMKIHVMRSVSGGEFAALVEGTGTRGGAGVTLGDADPAAAPLSEEMKKLQQQLGNYTYKGDIRPLVGMAKIAVTGKQTIRPILGGHVHLTEIQGDPAPGTTLVYQGRLMLGWDPKRGRYRAVEIGSFGEYNDHDVRFFGDQMVWLASTVLYGQPQLLRSVVTVKDGGKSVRLVTHRTAGVAPPEISFDVTSTRIDD